VRAERKDVGMKSARLAALAFAVSAPAWAQLSDEEHACQQAASKQSGTLAAKTIKCLVACDKQALKGKVPGGDCVPPFGGATLACVEGARTKVLDGIAKKCTLDCPECYEFGDCVAHAAALANDVGAEIAFVAPFVRCDDGASPDGLTTTEAKVRQKVALAVGKFAASSEKCIAKCRKAEAAGKVPAGSCVYLAQTDSKTTECLIKVGDKALDLLEDPELDAPECLAPSLSFALPITQGLLEEFDSRIFCSSPSGSFVD
jgi:hypothetical protein